LFLLYWNEKFRRDNSPPPFAKKNRKFYVCRLIIANLLNTEKENLMLDLIHDMFYMEFISCILYHNNSLSSPFLQKIFEGGIFPNPTI